MRRCLSKTTEWVLQRKGKPAKAGEVKGGKLNNHKCGLTKRKKECHSKE